MNAEVLLTHFDRISYAPAAVPSLRKFILDLAIRGKLVEQDPNDESASRLCERVSAEKLRRGRDSGRERSVSRDHLEMRGLYPLPGSWCWSTLAELGFISPRNEAPDEMESSFVPMPLIAAEYGVGNSHERRPWGEIKRGYTHFAEGDVGLAKITPCFENGKSTVFRNLTGGLGAGTTELHIVRPVLVLPEYILIYLKSSHFIESGIPRMTGTAGQKRVPVEYFSLSPFPLPPLTEQRRIVETVDEMMDLCDRFEAARNALETRRDILSSAVNHHLANNKDDCRLRDSGTFFINHISKLTSRPDHIKDLRQTILTLAVRGKLVRQHEDDEPAAALLDRIRTTLDSPSATGPVTRRKPVLPPVDATTAPFSIPKSWTWARFPELGTFGRGKSKHRPRNDRSLFDGGTHPLVQTGDVARSKGSIRTYTGLYNDVGLAQSQMWPAGTLCITIAANIADSGILTFEACFPDSVVGFLPASEFPNARYFEYFLRTAKEHLLEFAPATAQKNINLEILSSVLIPLPPLAEQARIVEAVDELMQVCDRLELELTTTQKQRNELLEAVLHHSLNPVMSAGLKLGTLIPHLNTENGGALNVV